MAATSTLTLRKLKGERPIVCITAYDALMARLADEAGVDLILVGDSVGNTMMGFETTVPVTLEMMALYTANVARARPRALVVTDIPFGVAAHSFDYLLDACVRLMQQCGAQAVKIEGTANMAPTVARLVEAGIPVLAHIGLLPQRVHELGGYRSYGRTEAGRKRMLDDALALEAAGAFAVLGEMIQADTSRAITEALKVPFIGIGCGPHCDGQILVCTDILGMGTGGYPSFSRQYAQIGQAMKDALEAYARDVRERTFPAH